MTRGKFVLITDDTVFVSCEFNGDMYYDDGHGIEAVERLGRVKDLDTFRKEVAAFDKANFGYQENYDDRYGIEDYQIHPSYLDFKEATYYDIWFSDYLYVLNLSSETKTITDYNGNGQTIEPNEIQIYCFGEYEGSSNNRYPNGTIKCVSDEDDEEPQFEEVTINSFTFDEDELRKLYDNNYITTTTPTKSELYDVLHSLIGNL